ncbi:MAG: hypothetical protein MUF64_16575 [Polyangiaceae bacterium]|nr:hypothetical protein [Polyangiaceae bacterium]
MAVPETKLPERVEIGRRWLDEAEVGVDADAGIAGVEATGEVVSHQHVATRPYSPGTQQQLQQQDGLVVDGFLGHILLVEQAKVIAHLDLEGEADASGRNRLRDGDRQLRHGLQASTPPRAAPLPFVLRLSRLSPAFRRGLSIRLPMLGVAMVGIAMWAAKRGPAPSSLAHDKEREPLLPMG